MNPFRSLLSVCMALLILLSTAGYSLHLHFCSGALQEAAFSQAAPSCHEGPVVPPCHPQGQADAEIPAADCCQSHFLQAEKAELQSLLLFKADFQKTFLWMVVAIPSFFSYLLHTPPAQHFAFYDIPLTGRDIPVLLQSFLI